MSTNLERTREAQRFLAQYFEPTRLLATDFGTTRTYLKLECELPTGSFKVRGALYSLWANCQRADVKEVVTASTGNHGAAVAYAARELGLRATIFLPRYSNRVKVAWIARLGAEIVEQGAHLTDAIDCAVEHAHRTGALFLHDASDPDIPLGTGTIGLEIAEQMPDVATIFVPVGDSALIRGIAAAVKDAGPGISVCGAVAAGAPAYYLSWREGKPIETAGSDTLADGLAVSRPLANNVASIRALVDDMALVTDDQMLSAAAVLWRRHQILAEPSAVAGLAALLASEDPRGPAVIVITGSNVGADVEKRIKALAADESGHRNDAHW